MFSQVRPHFRLAGQQCYACLSSLELPPSCSATSLCVEIYSRVPSSRRLLVGLRAYASSVQVPGCRNRQARRQRLSRHGLPPTACQSTVEVDVAVVGGGIIGLWVALQLLHHPTQPLVALIERELPCSGATGAGIA